MPIKKVYSTDPGLDCIERHFIVCIKRDKIISLSTKYSKYVSLIGSVGSGKVREMMKTDKISILNIFGKNVLKFYFLSFVIEKPKNEKKI